MKSLVLAFGAALLSGGAASAQTLGTVFGPDVDPGEREAEYRFGAELGDGGSFGHRLHYQHAIDDRFRWRAIVTYEDPAGGDLEFDHVQAELLWQLVERTPGGYSSGLRFDGRLSEGEDAAHEIGLNWTNQWVFGEGWRARALLLADRDVGRDARDGWFLETRFSLSKKLSNGLRLAVDSFHDFGNTDAGFGGFDDQAHQIGPALSGGVAENWGWSAGVLLGVSDDAPDQDVVFRLTREF